MTSKMMLESVGLESSYRNTDQHIHANRIPAGGTVVKGEAELHSFSLVGRRLDVTSVGGHSRQVSEHSAIVFIRHLNFACVGVLG